MLVSISINGQTYSHDVEPRLLLVHFIREYAELHGTHWGCDTSNCGICIVLMDGEPIKSCTTLAAMAEGHEIVTVEGMSKPDGTLDPIQQGFHEMHALQCGFCTPGMIMQSIDLLNENPKPSEEEIRSGLEGNLCRCTGYHNIVRAVQTASGQQTSARATLEGSAS
jgi:carbon-monoxide dehydrogenase small subunit